MRCFQILLRLVPFLLALSPTGHQVAFGAEAFALKDAAPFAIGVGISDRIDSRPGDWPLLKRHFISVTPENCMKPDPIQRQPGVWAWDAPDSFVNFALSNNLKVIGHCLVWAKDDRTPLWFCEDAGQPASREILLGRMKTHIETVVGRYRGRIAMWDVVNEALDDGTNYLRSSCWSRACGEDFIVKAFEYAHAADPNAVLIYNDYNNELPGKFAKMVRLIESLRAKNAPVHAIGLQGHYELDSVPFDAIEKTLSAMKAMKMKVVISELDIDVIPRARWWANGGAERDTLSKLNPYPHGCPPEILERQAAQYARLFAIFKKYSDQILRVTFWNLHDGQSWLNDFPWKRVNHPSRTVKIGRQEIHLRHTTIRNMAAAGRLSGLVIQAFKNLGHQHITPARVTHLKNTLPIAERKQLLRDISLAPGWMHPIFRELAEA